MSASRCLPLAAVLLAACPPDAATEPGSSGPGTSSGAQTEPPPDTAGTSDASDAPTTTGGPQLTGETVGSSSESGSSSGESGEPAPACQQGQGAGGTVLWEREGEDLPPTPQAMALTPGGEVVLVGSDWSPPATVGAAIVQVRDELGELVWSRTFEGEAGLRDEAVAVSVDPAGFVDVLVRELVFLGEHDGKNYGDVRLSVLRHTPDGAPLWRWERTREPTPAGVNYAPDGWIRSLGDGVRVLEVSEQQLTLLTIDADGSTIAEAPLTLPDHVGGVLVAALGPDGGAVVSASTGIQKPGWIGRFAGDGALQGAITEGTGASPDVVAVTDDGRIVAAWTGAHMDIDGVWLTRYSPRGEVEWTAQMPSDSMASWPRTIALRCDGSPLIGGSEYRGFSPAQKFMAGIELYVTRHDPDGAPLWRMADGLQGFYSDASFVDLVPTHDGDVLVLASYRFQPDIDTQTRPWFARLSGG